MDLAVYQLRAGVCMEGWMIKRFPSEHHSLVIFNLNATHGRGYMVNYFSKLQMFNSKLQL